MADTTLNMKLLLRRDEVFASSYILSAGEPGFEISTNIFKIGDGESTWSELPIANEAEISKLISSAISEHAKGYYTKTEVDNFISSINTAIGKKLDTATYEAYVELHKNDYSNDAIDSAVAGAKSHAETKISEFNASVVSPISDRVGAIEEDYVTEAEAGTIAQGKVETFKSEYVGVVPEIDGVSTVIDYVNKKTDGIATSGNLEALGNRVTTVEGEINTIKNDYVKHEELEVYETIENVNKLSDELAGYKTSNDAALADVKATAEAAYVKPEAGISKDDLDASVQASLDLADSALQSHQDISHLAVKSEVETELGKKVDKTVYEGVVEGLRSDIDLVKGDYLKQADKTELSNAITSAVSALAGEGNNTTVKAVSDRVGVVEGKLANVTNVMDFVGTVEALPEDVSSYHKGDVIVVTAGDDAGKEYVFDGTEFVEFGYADGNTAAIGDLQDRVGAIEEENVERDEAINSKLDASEFETYEADHANDYDNAKIDELVAGAKSEAEATAASALASAKSELEGKITAAETAAKQHATNLDSAMAARVEKLEGNEAGYTTTEQVATAKQEAIDAAASDATSKANTAEINAKGYVDSELADYNTETVAPIAARVKAIEDAPYATIDNVATAKQEAINAAQEYSDSLEHKNTTYSVAAGSNPLEFVVTPSEGEAQTVKLVAPVVDTGVMSVIAGEDMVVTPGENGAVTVAHETFTTGTYQKSPETSDKTGDVYLMTSVTVDNGHVTGANVQSLAAALMGMSFVLDGGNSTGNN